MALTTYSELLAAVASELARDDLATYIPDYVVRFEAAANRRLRVRQQETTATLTPSSGSASLPADYLSWRRVTWSGSPLRELEYVTPVYLNAQFPADGSGSPNVFTIEGSTLKVRPSSDTDIELDYFQKIPALATGANWLFTADPDAYLYGAMAEAQAFMRDFEAFAFWKLRRDEAFVEIETLSNKTRGVGGMRVLGPTP